jgi:hypothetical protein
VYRSGEKIMEIRTTDETYVYEVSHSPPQVQQAKPSNTRSRSKSFGNEKDHAKSVRFVDVLMAKNSDDNGQEEEDGANQSPSSHNGKSPRGGGSSKISAAGGRAGPSQVTLFGAPFHISFDARTTCGNMKELILSFLSRCSASSSSDNKLLSDKDFTIVAGNNEGSELGSELGDSVRGDNHLFGDWMEGLNVPKGNNGKALVVIWRTKSLKKLSNEMLNGWNPPKNNSSSSKSNGPNGGNSSTIPLNACFNHFLEKEQLGEDDLWFCSKCKDHVPAYKKFDLWTSPDILILHLKRFEYTPGQYFMHRQKINALVDFPLEQLDLTSFIKGPVQEGSPALYDLFGVSEHMGVMGGGHYTAVVKNCKDGAWYGFDDSKVSSLKASDACTPNAYVLFYERRGRPARWAGIQVPPAPPPQTKGK